MSEMFTIELTADEVRYLRGAAKVTAMPRTLSDKVDAFPLAKKPVRCYHCRDEQANEDAYYAHLLTAHRYPDEDAGSEAGRAFENQV